MICPTQAVVDITIYDLLGRKIQRLVNSVQNVGSHALQFDANELPSGIYIYRLTIDGASIDQKKMVILK